LQSGGWHRLCSSVGMRVIAGTYRRRTLVAPAGLETRPTSDRLRETLFNVLAPEIEGARFADLYAGTGAVGIEALSRGAAHVTFVESAADPLRALRSNLATLGINSGYQLEQRSVPITLRTLVRRDARSTPGFTLVYLDPPWEDATAYQLTLSMLGEAGSTLLAPGALVIAEHARRKAVAPFEHYGVLRRYRVLEQGDAALSFYRHEDPDTTSEPAIPSPE
jgi:16S rRNA (guanine966-N2)-methyltransferase